MMPGRLARYERMLSQLEQNGRRRVLAQQSGIDFTSNDYLGYATTPNPVADDLPRSGIASRLLRGHHAIWEEVESSLAKWHGAAAVLMMTSGYADAGDLAEPGFGEHVCFLQKPYRSDGLLSGVRSVLA